MVGCVLFAVTETVMLTCAEKISISLYFIFWYFTLLTLVRSLLTLLDNSYYFILHAISV